MEAIDTQTEPTVISQREAAAVFGLDAKYLRKYAAAADAVLPKRGSFVPWDLDRLAAFLAESDPARWGGLDPQAALAEVRRREAATRATIPITTPTQTATPDAPDVTGAASAGPTIAPDVSGQDTGTVTRPAPGAPDVDKAGADAELLEAVRELVSATQTRENETALAVRGVDNNLALLGERIQARLAEAYEHRLHEQAAALAGEARRRQILTALCAAAVIVAVGVGGLTIYLQRSLSATRQQAAAQVAQATTAVTDQAETIEALTGQLETTASRLEQSGANLHAAQQVAQTAQAEATRLAEGNATLEREKAATDARLAQAQQEAETWEQVAGDRQEALTDAQARVKELEAVPESPATLTGSTESLQ